MNLRAILSKVWQDGFFKIEEIVFLLESGADLETLVDTLTLLSKRRISVNKAEEALEAKKCVR